MKYFLSIPHLWRIHGMSSLLKGCGNRSIQNWNWCNLVGREHLEERESCCVTKTKKADCFCEHYIRRKHGSFTSELRKLISSVLKVGKVSAENRLRERTCDESANTLIEIGNVPRGKIVLIMKVVTRAKICSQTLKSCGKYSILQTEISINY